MLTDVEKDTALRIYFLLLAKFPRLLYTNYFENGKLIAHWLGLVDDGAYWKCHPRDAIQPTSQLLAMDDEETMQQLTAAMVDVEYASRNPS